MEDQILDNNLTSQPPIQSVPPGEKPYKKLFIILVVVVIIIVSIAAVWVGNIIHMQQINNEAEQLGVAAQADYKRGDYKAAEEKLTKAIKLTNAYPNLFASMISVIAAEGNTTGHEDAAYSQAQPFVNQALKLYPKSKEIMLAVGYLDETDGKYQNALDMYNQALAIDPSNAQGWFHKGHDLEFLQNQKEAFQAYDKAYSLDPNNGRILIAKGREAAIQLHIPQAHDFFIKAAESSSSDAPTKAEAYTDAAVATRTNLLKLNDALTLSKKAVDAYPRYGPGLAQYALSLYLTGDLVNAVNNMDQAIKLNPRITHNYYYMAGFLRSGKKYQDAITFLKKGLSLVDADNTLLTEKDKRSQKELLTYEIAKTMSFSGGNSEELGYLQSVIAMDNTYKTTIKNDYIKYNYFIDLANNKDFQNLIK